MTAKEVLKLLNISRQTLTKYVKTGVIKVETLSNNRYDYNKEDVLRMFTKGKPRKTYIYVRATGNNLEYRINTQIELLKQLCTDKGYEVDDIIIDRLSWVEIDDRKGLARIVNEVMEGEVGRVVIYNKQTFSGLGFNLISEIFERYHCEITRLSNNEHIYLSELIDEVGALAKYYGLYVNKDEIMHAFK